MSYRLADAARAEGYRLHVHERLESTNTQALALAASGEAGPLWVVAHRQEAGRGRRGNLWVSPPGNLAASLLFPVRGVPRERIATFGFVAGLALAEALADLRAPGGDCARMDALREFRLKWPNDVLYEGGKLAGILLETETGPGGRLALVAGFGVNVEAAPEGLPYAATSLRAAGLVADAAGVFQHLTGRMAQAVRLWNEARNFPAIRQRWLARANGLGEPVSVRRDGGILAGTFETIYEEGRLVILAPDGARQIVTAGDVYFGEAATAA